MSKVKALQFSFDGGIISDTLYGRIDDKRRQSGLAECENFVVSPGNVANRKGFAFVSKTAREGRRSNLINFDFSVSQTMLIELSHLCFRFFVDGRALLVPDDLPQWLEAKLYEAGDLVYKDAKGYRYYCCKTHTSGHFENDVSSGFWSQLSFKETPEPTALEIPHPYEESEIFDVQYVQSADVLTFTHVNHPPATLRRRGAAILGFSEIAFNPSLNPPTNLKAASSKTNAGGINYAYVVTALNRDRTEESVASETALVYNNLLLGDSANIIKWDHLRDDVVYNAYRLKGGLYGYIGTTDTKEIRDDNIAPDMSKTPPRHDDIFKKAGDWPGAVAYYEQRKCFAGTLNEPQRFWATRSGTEDSMVYSLPSNADDRLSFRLVSRDVNEIKHIVPANNLVLLTASSEWRIVSGDQPLSASNFVARPQTYAGASSVRPLTINNSILFGANRGGHLREMYYVWQTNSYTTVDLSLRAHRLFDGFEIVGMAYSKTPFPVVWCVSSSGSLLGLTYIKEEEYDAWHEHTTYGGSFEACTVVREAEGEFLYCVVSRIIQGRSLRSIERMALTSSEDFYVDCGFSYSGGSPSDTFGGLEHLEGELVSVLGDGGVQTPRRVVNGTVRLDSKVSKAFIGLPIKAQVRTLPVAVQTAGSAETVSSFAQGCKKNVNKAFLRVARSSSVWCGPTEDKLRQYKQRSTENLGEPTQYINDEVEIALDAMWTRSGQITIAQRDPLPLVITALTLEISLGG